MNNWMKQFEYKRLVKPLGVLLILSFVYNLAYLMLSTFIFSYAVQITLSLLSSVGLYWICHMLWERKTSIEFPQIFQVLIIELIWLLLIFVVLEPLYQMSANQVWADIFVQLFCGILILFVYPFEILYFYQLHLGKTKVKDIFKGMMDVLKKSFIKITNYYCFLLIGIVLIDTLTGGILSVISGLNTYQLFRSMMMLSNPLMNSMMHMFLIANFGMVDIQSIFTLFIYFIIGIWVGFFELNYIIYIERKCEE